MERDQAAPELKAGKAEPWKAEQQVSFERGLEENGGA